MWRTLPIALESAMTDVSLRARDSEIMKAGGYPVIRSCLKGRMRLQRFGDRTINKHRVPHITVSKIIESGSQGMIVNN